MLFNDTRYKAFNEAWFVRNQVFLLFLLNNFTTKQMFRKIFGMQSKMNTSQMVLAIMPNHFKASRPDDAIFASFYAFDHNSIVVYKNLKYFWLALHFWDMQIANKYMPSLNLGYDALQINSSGLVVAGIVSMGYSNYNWKLSWDEIRTGIYEEFSPVASHVLFNNNWSLLARVLSSGFQWLGDDYNTYCLMQRSVLSFNTSAIGAGNTVISASLNINLASPVNYISDLQNDNLVLVGHDKITSYINDDNDLTAADYSNSMFGTDIFSEITWDYYETNAPMVHNFALNQLGCDWIKKTAHTAFGFMVKCDAQDTEPPLYLTQGDETCYTLSINENTTLDLVYNPTGNQIVMMM